MKRLLLTLAAGSCLLAALPSTGFAAGASENHAVYTWVVGVDPPFTNTAIAPDGSTITVSGSGALQAGPGHTASGGGTYALSSGGSGNWTVTGMLGFVSYGNATPQGLPANLFGGETKLRIQLDNGTDGVLTITCVLGVPPPAKTEGVAVVLGQGGEFTKHDGGDNVFIH